MKKIYQIPSTLVTKLSVKSSLLDGSMRIQNSVGDTDAMVKENRGSSQSDYNVWSDDWSK